MKITIETKDLSKFTMLQIAEETSDEDTLTKFAEAEKEIWSYLRAPVARNIHTSSKTLSKLAEDEDYSVRYAVASNPNTFTETLNKLAEDEESNIRERVALNLNTSFETLSKLAEDEVKDVREAVAKNPNTSAEILSKIAKNLGCSVEEEVAVALHHNTSAETLRALATSNAFECVKKAIASNPNTPTEIVSKLEKRPAYNWPTVARWGRW